MYPWVRTLIAGIQTGSSELRSPCGMKRRTLLAAAEATWGAARTVAAAPAANPSRFRRLMGGSPYGSKDEGCVPVQCPGCVEAGHEFQRLHHARHAPSIRRTDILVVRHAGEQDRCVLAGQRADLPEHPAPARMIAIDLDQRTQIMVQREFPRTEPQIVVDRLPSVQLAEGAAVPDRVLGEDRCLLPGNVVHLRLRLALVIVGVFLVGAFRVQRLEAL